MSHAGPKLARPADPAAEGPEELAADHFDRLPDSVVLVIFNRIGDVKDLGRCCVVSRRFHSLSSQVDDVLVRVDCVISDPDDSHPSASVPVGFPSSSDKARGVLSHLARVVLGGIAKPFQALGQFLGSGSPSSLASAVPKRSSCVTAASSDTCSSSDVSHHSPTEVLKHFREVRRLRIELPAGELGVDDGAFLKWKAEFGSTLEGCVILGASSVHSSSSSPLEQSKSCEEFHEIGSTEGFCGGTEDSGSIPGSFYTNGSLRQRVVWTVSSLIAASARHYLLHPIIADHETLESLDLTDADGQGVLRMGRAQVEELRVKPVSASGSSQRTLVPALNMRLWYAPRLELPGGVVLEGATLVAIRPSEQPKEGLGSDGGWISGAFEEPYGTAVKLLMKRKTYCLEMNSF